MLQAQLSSADNPLAITCLSLTVAKRDLAEKLGRLGVPDRFCRPGFATGFSACAQYGEKHAPSCKVSCSRADVSLVFAVGFAQNSQPILPLQLHGDAQPTQLPHNASLAGAQCDGSGNVYLRYAPPGSDAYSIGIAKISPDGEMQTISLGNIPDAVSTHPFIFAPATDETLHEILRMQTSDQQNPGTQVDYVRFDPDGSVRSTSEFGDQFIPSILIPLPNGNFFATGVNIKSVGDGVAENSIAGIFSPDAKLLQPLRTADKKSGASTDTDAVLQGGAARLGGDGNIYALLPGDQPRVAVIGQDGLMRRVIRLQLPSDSYAASDMWASGGRLLVAYSGQTDDGNDAQLFVLYDATTGAMLRAYRQHFEGTAACFEDGQTMSFLVKQPSSGVIGIGTAELQ